MAMICALLVVTSAAWSLTAADVGALVMVEISPSANMLVEHASWLPDGVTPVLGGWQMKPDACAVGVFRTPASRSQLCPEPVSPHFAVSPDGLNVAFWRRVPLEEGVAAELSVLNLDSGAVSTLGAPRAINPAMHIAWLSDSLILYSFQSNSGDIARLFVADIQGGAPAEVIEMEGGKWTSLTQTTGPTAISEFAVGGGRVRHQIAADSTGQVSAVLLKDISESKDALELDADGRLIFSNSHAEGVIIDTGVTSYCLSPDKCAVVYTTPHELRVSDVAHTRTRVLHRFPPDTPPLLGCSWAPGTSHICVWSGDGRVGQAWYVTLGSEEVTVRFRFPAGSAVKTNDTLWVAQKFFKDEFGRAKEPDWRTLKGQFVVERVLRGTDEIIAEAKSVGTEGSIVERLAGSDDPPELEDGATHIRIGPASEPPTQWMHSFRAAVLPDLAAWLQGTTEIGEPLTLSVERQILLPVGPQH